MSSLIARFSTRNATLLAALAMAVVCWSSNTALLILWDGMAFVAALLPPPELLARRTVLAALMAGAAAFGVNIYSRALQRKMRSLNQCDLQYTTMLESTFDSVLTIDSGGAVIAANSAAANAFGRASADFSGLNIDDLTVRIVDQRVEDSPSLLKLIQSDDDWQHGALQVIARGLDGREFPAEVNVVPVSYGDRDNRLVIVREVTERVAFKEALKRSEEQYRDLFEHVPDGVYRTLHDGTVLAANPAMARILGFASADELVRYGNTRDVHADEQQARALDKQVRETGSASDVMIDIKRKDGSIKTVIADVRRVSDPSAEKPVYQSTFSDISELRAATDALKDSEEHFRALTENAVDMVTVINEAGEVLYCSPACLAVTGFMPEDLVGRNAFDGVHRDDRERAEKSIAYTFSRSNESKSFTCRYLRADREIIEVETIGSAFRNSKGEPRAVLNSRDVTERRKTEQQLQQAQKMQAIGHLTGGVAHDFNNLLTVIVGNLQLIGEGDLDPETDSQVNTAYRAAMQGADLTRRLLAFARRQPLEPKVIDVGKLLFAMDPLLHRSLGKLMNIRMELADDLWLSKVDPAQLESAILNLAINSRDAMDGEGLLTIRTKNCAYGASGLREDPVLIAGEYVCISVEDYGCGMSEEIRKAAVEPFFSTKDDKNSSGLGLSMVYGFVQQSGGHISLDSREAEGTRIDLYLPRSSELETSVEGLNGSAATPTGSEKILIVDDNSDVRRSAATILSKLGYETLEAPSGSEALEVLGAGPVDLVFSDIKMPEMSGLELAEKVRSQTPATEILLTSGFSDQSPPGDKARSFEFLRKPYSRHELATRLRSILDNRND